MYAQNFLHVQVLVPIACVIHSVHVHVIYGWEIHVACVIHNVHVHVHVIY